MRLDAPFGVGEAKQTELRERLARLGLDASLIEERFIRGGGKGGQKIAKTANCVVLSYAPLGLQVRCQRDRRLAVNRFLALRELVDEAELLLRPETARRTEGLRLLRKRKSRRRARARAKYGAPPFPPGTASGSGVSRTDGDRGPSR